MNEPKQVIDYAHIVVHEAWKHIKVLEKKWKVLLYSKKQKESLHEIKNIQKLISIIAKKSSGMAQKKAEIAFRYFSATVIYSECIIYTCMKDFNKNSTSTKISEKIKSSNGIKWPPNLTRTIDIEYLNEIAKRILAELKASIFDYDERIERMQGKLASIRSPGNIPFMQVYSTPKEKVSIRRNFEFAIDSSISVSETEKIITADEDLSELPTRVFCDGLPQSGHLLEKKLSEIIPHEEFRRKLLIGKYVSWIHVSLPDKHTSNKTLYEIDIIDRLVKLNPKQFLVNEGKLKKMGGTERLNWEKKEENGVCDDFSQEDILISNFANCFFEYSSNMEWSKCECTGLLDESLEVAAESSTDIRCKFCLFSAYSELWCNEQIEECVLYNNNPGERSEMYIGFCFRSILEGGYGSEDVVNGAKNLYLLALVRGAVNLAESMMAENHYPTSSVPIKSNNTSDHGERNTYKLKIRIPDFNKEYAEWMSYNQDKKEIRDSKHYGVVPVDKSKKHPFLLGATYKSITIKAKFPLVFLVLSIIGVVVVLSYSIPMGIRQRTEKNYEEYFGSLPTLISAVTGIVLLLTKCCYKKWEIVDMCYRKRTTHKLSELTAAIPGGRSEAIRVCCSINNPKKVFSQWMSCAFAHDGQGEFEIDEKIRVEELKEAGMLFGVDYYGRPIVSDPQGNIRTLHFPKDQQEQDYLHIGCEHNLKIGHMFKVPIEDLEVGSRHNMDSIV